MSQEEKIFVCKKCGKEVKVLQEGKNPNPPACCGDPMELKECCK